MMTAKEIKGTRFYHDGALVELWPPGPDGIVDLWISHDGACVCVDIQRLLEILCMADYQIVRSFFQYWNSRVSLKLELQRRGWYHVGS